jgi:colanic acid biosynthesis glycosyl transferase WcaI
LLLGRVANIELQALRATEDVAMVAVGIPLAHIRPKQNFGAMKILIVTQYFWPENFRINDLAQGLRNREHEVTVYTGKPNYPEGRFFSGYGFLRRSNEAFDGIRVIRVPLIPRGGGAGFRLALNYVSFAFFASLLAPFRVYGDFDVILVYEPSPVTVGLPALVLKALKGAPLLFWVQDLWPESLIAADAVRQRWILAGIERLVRFIYRRCDRILVQSKAFIEAVLRYGIVRERIFFFPNSAEALYQPLALEPNAPEREKMPPGFRVMYAGNVGAAQDFATILGAADRLRDETAIQWVILGDGRLRSWVESEVARRGLGRSVHLLGRYPVESMPRFFALGDAMLVTLRRDPILAMTLPSRVQSYLACARPIVAALDGEGARVIKEAGAGIVAGSGDPDGLVRAVLDIYRLPEAERQAMGASGRRYFEKHFEREMLLTRLEEWMQSATETHGTAQHRSQKH